MLDGNPLTRHFLSYFLPMLVASLGFISSIFFSLLLDIAATKRKGKPQKVQEERTIFLWIIIIHPHSK
jgi:hypothetical protein